VGLMIKVCHVTHGHKSTDTRIFHKQCASLVKVGYDVYLIALLAKEDYEENGVKVKNVPSYVPFKLKHRCSRFKIVKESTLLRKARTWLNLLKERIFEDDKFSMIFKKCIEVDADIYQIHEIELLPCALKLKKKGKKVIFDSHEGFEFYLKSYLTSYAFESVWGLIILPISIFKPVKLGLYHCVKKHYSSIVRKLDAVITVTPSEYEYFKKLNKSTYMISNFPIVKDKYINKLEGLNSNTIIYAGGITKNWSHDKIIKALEKVDNVKYTLLGPVLPEEYLDELKNISGWKFVDFLGQTPHEEVSRELEAAAVGMAIHVHNGNTNYEKGTLGNTKVFEYMMVGLPVICTNFVLWRESFIEKYNCGICVEPDNIEQIAEAINYLLENPKIAKEMGQNGRRAVLEEFNWDIEEKKLLGLYESLQERRA